jgi:ABC-type glycerol-3-phosphate transport system substrate-binding protein
MFYNKDLIDEYGLKDPLELYDRGQWTWDAFLDLAVQATRDTNKDGTTDTWGINGDARRVYQSLLTSNGGDIVDYDTDSNTYSLAFEKPAAMKALLKVAEIVNTLKVAKADTFMTADADTSFASGKALFLMAGLPGHIVDMRNTNGLKNVRWMSLPRGPDDPIGNLNFIRESNYYAWTTTIGADWENVVKATSWLFTTWDYVRYPEIDPGAAFDKQAWIDATLKAGTFDAADTAHIAKLMFDQGTVVIKWPAWQPLADVINESILRRMVQGKTAEESISPFRDSMQQMLDSMVKSQ